MNQTTIPEPTGSRCQECLLPRELEIMLLVVSVALALSFCLLLGYLCRWRLDKAAKGCRNCFGPPPTPPRGYYGPVTNFRDLPPQPDPGPCATIVQTLRVLLRGEDNTHTEERIELRISVNALPVPSDRVTGRRQRPGAAMPSADPGAALGRARVPIAVCLEDAPVMQGREADGYVTPSPSLIAMTTAASALTLTSPKMQTPPPTAASAPSTDRRSPSSVVQRNVFFPDPPKSFTVGEPSAVYEDPRPVRMSKRTQSESSAL